MGSAAGGGPCSTEGAPGMGCSGERFRRVYLRGIVRLHALKLSEEVPGIAQAVQGLQTNDRALRVARALQVIHLGQHTFGTGNGLTDLLDTVSPRRRGGLGGT